VASSLEGDTSPNPIDDETSIANTMPPTRSFSSIMGTSTVRDISLVVSRTGPARLKAMSRIIDIFRARLIPRQDCLTMLFCAEILVSLRSGG